MGVGERPTRALASGKWNGVDSITDEVQAIDDALDLVPGIGRPVDGPLWLCRVEIPFPELRYESLKLIVWQFHWGCCA